MDQKQDETNQTLDETTISINHLQSMCMNTHKALVGKFGVSLPIDGNLSQFTRVRCNKLHTHQLIC
jgi:hypothetical protein